MSTKNNLTTIRNFNLSLLKLYKMKAKFLILICSLFLLAGCKAGFPIEGNTYSSGKCRSTQCYAKTKAGNRCKNMTTNCSGRCHVH